MTISFPEELLALAGHIVSVYRQKRLTIATAESCTGGLVAGILTSISGSSDVFERGFVSYSNLAKTELLGVPEDLISEFGAVSDPVAHAMALGALSHSAADVAVSVTGVSGPGGGTADKPVGLTFLGSAIRAGDSGAQRFQFSAKSRHGMRLAAVAEALNLLKAIASD